MMLTIKSARAPRWDTDDHTCLTLMVIFKEYAGNVGEIPFTASANDATEHGRALFARALAGEFGAIRAYAPPIVTGAQLHEQWKAQREAAVATIVVHTSQGRAFDGDEVSQGRMARAVIALMDQPPGTTVRWVLADNSAAMVGVAELKEALTLAGLRQTELWVKP